MGDAGEFVRTQNELADQAAAWVRRLAVDACRGEPIDRRLLALHMGRIGRMGEIVQSGRLGLLEVVGHVIHPHPDDVDRLNQDRGTW